MMKSWLIKFGKGLSAMKNDGLIRGGKRAVKAFFSQFGRVKPGDVLFVTAGLGDSARYRAHNQAEELELHGFKCSVTIQDNPFLTEYVDKFNIFIFHRTIYIPKIEKLIEGVKKAGKEIIFETDDLVFDPKYIQQTEHYKKMNVLERRQYEKGVGEEILKDQYVRTCVTTTSYLANILEGYDKKVYVSKNKLSSKDLEIVEKILSSCSPRAELSEIKIGYFAGTKGHDKNFATVDEVLMKILEKYQNVKLVLAGPLSISDKFERYKSQISRLLFAERKEHFKNISNVDINIIPLEQDNPFCESKSELKFFEAGILGVPSVAINNQTYREAIVDGVDGFLAGNSEEWFSKLEKLVLNKDLREKMGKKAREKSLREYATKNSRNEEYYGYLRSKLN